MGIFNEQVLSPNGEVVLLKAVAGDTSHHRIPPLKDHREKWQDLKFYRLEMSCRILVTLHMRPH